ncbi:hypothetical protein [Escherichia phage PH1062]|nr:hypothetical protein [Escherichia phage PH1062]
MSNKNINFPVFVKCLYADYFEVGAESDQVEILASDEMVFLTPDQALAMAAALVSAANKANNQLGRDQA